jgi:hypothetical protein
MRWIHIIGGLIGITSGAVALIALKGAQLHRWSGTVFVYSMLVMTSTAIALAAWKQPYPGNIVAGVITFYMVATAMLTVRRPRQRARLIDISFMLAAVALGVVCIGMGQVRHDEPGLPGGYPPPFYFVLGGVALMLARQDQRMIAAGGPHGTARLKRHLGRMCGAMIVATGSLFLGQPQVFAGGPLEPVGVRAIPVLLVIAAMMYWRVRLARRPPTLREMAPDHV